MPEPNPPAAGEPSKATTRFAIPANKDAGGRAFGEQRDFQAQFSSDSLVFDRSDNTIKPLSTVISVDGGKSELASFRLIPIEDTKYHSHSAVLQRYEMYLRKGFDTAELQSRIDMAGTTEIVRLNSSELWKEFSRAHPQQARELVIKDPHFVSNLNLDPDHLKEFIDALHDSPEYKSLSQEQFLGQIRQKVLEIRPEREAQCTRVYNKEAKLILQQQGFTPEQSEGLLQSGAVTVEGKPPSVKVDAEKMGPIPENVVTNALNTMQDDLLRSFKRSMEYLAERSVRTPYAQAITPEEARAAIQKAYDAMPEGGLGRRLFDRALSDPELKVFVVNEANANAYLPTRMRDDTGGFNHPERRAFYVALDIPNFAGITLEEATHNLIGRTYDNKAAQPYMASNDPRKTLLESAIAADRNMSMARELGLQGYPEVTYHAEIPAKILVMKAEGKWTPELAERYSHLDQFVEKVVLPDIEAVHAKQPLPTIDVAEYKAALPAKEAMVRPAVVTDPAQAQALPPEAIEALKKAGFTVDEKSITAPGEQKPLLTKGSKDFWEVKPEQQGELFRTLMKPGPLADAIQSSPMAFDRDVVKINRGAERARPKDGTQQSLHPEATAAHEGVGPKPVPRAEEHAAETPIPRVAPHTEEVSHAHPRFRLGNATTTGVALAGIGKGIIQQYQNGPDALGTTMIAGNTALLAGTSAEAFYVARAESLFKAATVELEAVGQASKMVRAAEAFQTANKLRSTTHMAGNTLGAFGVALDVNSAIQADNTFSRVGHSANAAIGVGMLAVGGEAAGALAYVGPAGAVAAVAISGAIEINEAWQEGVRNVESSNKALYGAKITDRFIGNAPGTDAEKLSPHIEEYQQLNIAGKMLKESDPVKLHARITEEITRLESLPDYASSQPSFVKDVIGTDRNRAESNAPLKVAILKSALEELGTPGDADGKFGEEGKKKPTYFSRVEQYEKARGFDKDRAEYLQSQLDRLNELSNLRERSELSPERLRQELARDMQATDLELGMLKDMTPAQRDAYLRDNEKFLKEAGVAHYSPLAQSMLTYDNLIEKAASIGIPAKDLEAMGFEKEVAGAREQNTKRLQDVVKRLESEGKLAVDDKTLGFHHLNIHPGPEATPNDRAEYSFARSKLGIPARIGSHIDRDILATVNPKVKDNEIETTGYIKQHQVMLDAEAKYLKDHPAAAQCVQSGLCQSGLEYFSRFGAYKGETYGGVGLKDIQASTPMDRTESSLNRTAQEIVSGVSGTIMRGQQQQVEQERKAEDQKAPKTDISEVIMNLFVMSRFGAIEGGKPPRVGIICEGDQREMLISELNKRNIPFKVVPQITVEGYTSNDGGIIVEWKDIRSAGPTVMPDIVKSKVGVKMTAQEADISLDAFSVKGLSRGNARNSEFETRQRDSGRINH